MHSGITLAPLVGQMVARELLGDSDAALLAACRPGRFG